ncbi:MAG: hypothetical protein KF681_07250 [Bdellovibrionaceae bacterium]|nr:hypothetical protein [Pseudobdellovibrionaceae bacterium]
MATQNQEQARTDKSQDAIKAGHARPERSDREGFQAEDVEMQAAGRKGSVETETSEERAEDADLDMDTEEELSSDEDEEAPVRSNTKM